MAPLLRPRVAKTSAALALVMAGAGALAACTVDGALMPTDIASVGSITPPAPIGGNGLAYSAASSPPVMPATQQPMQTMQQPMPQPVAGPVVSTTAVQQQSLPPAAPAAAQTNTPDEDPAGLSPASANAGTPVVVDAESLAEGVTDQPVVTGIGTGNPVEFTGRSEASQAPLPQSETETEIYNGPRQLGAPPQPLSLPPGAPEAENVAPQADAPVQVAAMPRVADPLPQTSEPEIMAPSPAPVKPAPAPQSTWNGGSGMPASEVACRQELKRLGVGYTDIPRISDGRACGIEWPIKLTSLSGGIRIKPGATLNCQVTAEFAKWVKSDLAPAARMRYLSGIKSITQLSSYSCRTMNSQRGAPMSEHAHGNAIDIGSITLNSGRKIDVRKPGWFAFRKRGFLNTVRAESCDNFTTVLGPGSNKYHWNHFHFDLRQRKSGRSYCD
jgi:hypothetical protein